MTRKTYKTVTELPEGTKALEYTGDNYNELKEFIGNWVESLTHRYSSSFVFSFSMGGEVSCTLDKETKIAYLKYINGTEPIDIGDFVVKNECGELEILRESMFYEKYEKPDKMSEEQIAQFLYDNCYNEKNDCIDLSFLDFRKFNCNVYLSYMKVKKDLHQAFQYVEGDLYAGYNQVAGHIMQGENLKIKGENKND